MLKIKDSIDLKQLERFGYKVIDWNCVVERPYDVPLCTKMIKRYNKKKNVHFLDVYIENRIIKLIDVYYTFWIERQNVAKKYIQDIIDAGFVEKV